MINSLRQHKFFDIFPDNELQKLSSIMMEKSFGDNDLIFLENMPGEALYIVDEGSVKITKMIAEGEELQLSILKKGDILGEMAIIEGGRRAVTARPINFCRLLIIKKRDFSVFLDREPAVGYKFQVSIMRMFIKKLRMMDDKINEMLLSQLD
jgi:CRP-like cAMP-binding protein